MPPSKNISFDELSKYFHLPINQVAKELGVCATILKKICRKNGIPRWPHRKIKSLDKMIANLEVNLSKNRNGEEEDLNHEVELLRTKKNEIMRNPDILVSKNLNRAGLSKQGTLANRMKKTKPSREVYTINTFKAKELSQADELDALPDDWQQEVALPPGKATSDLFHILADAVPASVAALRRGSLPSLELYHSHLAPLSSPTTINLPPPFRRHSVDSHPPSRTPFSLSGTFRSGPPLGMMDLSQKLPAFNPSFHTVDVPPLRPLPCIEPLMNTTSPETQEYPDWYVAEKKRVFGSAN